MSNTVASCRSINEKTQTKSLGLSNVVLSASLPSRQGLFRGNAFGRTTDSRLPAGKAGIFSPMLWNK